MNKLVSTATSVKNSRVTTYKVVTLNAILLIYLLARLLLTKKLDRYSIKEVTIKDPFSDSTVKIMADNTEINSTQNLDRTSN